MNGGEWSERVLVGCVVTSVSVITPQLSILCWPTGLHNTAIVVLGVEQRQCKVAVYATIAHAQDTMESPHLKSMPACDSGILPLRVPSPLAAFAFVSCLPYFISSLDDYKSSPTSPSCPCLSLHHPFVGCHPLQYTILLPLYQILVSPHIYNSLISSPSHGSRTPSFLSFSSRSASSCPRTRRRRP